MLKLFRGERPLWFTFWIGWFLFGMVLMIPTFLYNNTFESGNFFSIPFISSYILFLFLVLIYLGAILWGLWKSATAYMREKGFWTWGFVVKCIVVINVLLYVFALIPNTVSELQASFYLINIIRTI